MRTSRYRVRVVTTPILEVLTYIPLTTPFTTSQELRQVDEDAGQPFHAGCRDGIQQTPELGAREPGDHRCEGLHRLARHHNVAESPPLAALQKPLTQLILGSDQDDRKLERVLTRKAEHGCGASGSAVAGD